jgi:Saccharopine dehydrogenase and related proteins
MKHILVLGAGKTSAALIDYLIAEAAVNNWQLTVADASLVRAQSTTHNAPHTSAVQLHVENTDQRIYCIARADLVISLLPQNLEYLVAKDCIQLSKHLLSASPINDELAALHQQVVNKGLLFLYETGIDHMRAMQLIHRIKAQGGAITSFTAHSGQLMAPGYDDNPWHYKTAGNPQRVVLAGKNGAVFRENGQSRQMSYEALFDANRAIHIPGLGFLAWYPNGNSLGYLPLYQLSEARTFIRSTLQYPEFCFGWKNIVELKLTDETPQYQTDGMSLQIFFQEHFAKHGFSEWIEKQLTSRFTQTKQLLEKLQQLLEAEQNAGEEERKALQDFMMVDNLGQLMDVNLDSVKTQAAATVAGQMHEANLSMKQLFYLGMDDNDTIIDKGLCSAADVLQFVLEKKLALQPGDRDITVIQHEIGYEQDGVQQQLTSCMMVQGDEQTYSARAQTVGLPLGIAAKLILQNAVQLKGVHLPVSSQIYEPVLAGLAPYGVQFEELVS